MTREQKLEEAEKEITASHKERERWIDYTIDLQRIIEALCDRRGLPEPLSTARHHYNMAKEFLTRAALTAGEEAGGVKVKALEWVLEDERDPEFPRWHADGLGKHYSVFKAWWGTKDKWGYFFEGFHDTSKEAKAAAQADYERRILSAIEPTPSPIVDDAMVERAAQGILDRMSDTFKAGNGRNVGIQGDDGEKCWIVHSDDIEALRAALSGAREEGE